MLSWIGNRFGSEGRVFPLGVGGRLLLLFLAVLVGNTVYQGVSRSLYNSYRDAVANAQVIASFLSAYPNSPQLAKSPEEDAEQKGISTWRPVYSLTPGDLVTLLSEAGITEEDDVAKPVDIFDLKSNGVGAWLATAIVSTNIVEDHSLARVWVSGEIPCVSSGESSSALVSTLEGLVFLYRSMGNSENGPSESTGDGSGDCVAVVPAQVREQAQRITDLVVGEHPSFFSIGAPEPATEPYAAIKQAMALPWKFFGLDRFGQPDPTNHPAGDNQLLVMSFVKPAAGHGFYQEATNCGNECKAKLSELSWFKEDPSRLEASLVKFSNLLLESIMSSDNVKQSRFLYQAWRGWIQWIIIVIFWYVVWQLVWRGVAVYRNKDRPQKGAFFPPVVTIGEVSDWEDAVFQSRRFVDQWINTLPLLGLLGTVVGILFGLPNASAAINAKGPTASTSVNQLFEQLGLAFGTTALAVLAVVVLQMLWEVIQYYEDKFLAKRNS